MTVLDRILSLRDKHFDRQGIYLYEYQRTVSDRIIIALVQNLVAIRSADEATIAEMETPEVALEFSRQSGKTTAVVHTVEFIMVFFPTMFNRPISVGLFAPQKEQAKTDFDRLKSLLAKSQREFTVSGDEEGNRRAKEENNARTVVLRNSGMCFIAPVTKQSKAESKSFDLMIFEEAQDINDQIMKGDIFPMGAATNAPRILIGTAGFTKCYFYGLIKSGKALVMKWREVVKDRHKAYEATGNPFHLLYDTYVKNELKKMARGEEDDDFRRPYNLEWIMEVGMFVTDDELIKCRVLHPYNLEDPANLQYDHYAGLDTAKKQDRTVLKIGREIDGKLTTVYSIEISGMNYEDQFHLVADIIRKFHLIALSIDSTGQGDFMPDLFDNLEDREYFIIRVNFSLLTKDTMYKSWLNKILKDRFGYFYSELEITATRFEQETLDLVKEYKSDKFMSVHHPDEADAHDDHPDATVLMVNSYDEYNRSSGIIDYYKEAAAPTSPQPGEVEEHGIV